MAWVERARPWLGTITTIRAVADDPARAAAAIDAAFAAVALVHRRMSFQSADSDLSAIGRLGAGRQVTVDPATADCLAQALRWGDASGGAFDPVVPGAGASWRDLRIDGARVTVLRPLRIDLSGIAKGYAVDRACAVLADAGVSAAMVNAGGDLRTFGTVETVTLTPHVPAPPVAVRIEDGALASSDVAGSLAEYGAVRHRDGRTGAASPAAFVSIAAPCCADADALTKVVLALDVDACDLLSRHGAVAYVHCADTGWRTIGEEA